ncbi:MAG: hypothetical protein PHU88_05730 [candidate division Zixibacteria bacterium]|nr:hypothetical protein [candidate division Zixibacteria bacterium]MDD5426579.1 hypothetical protein [candidate division Zixibacteria bacterium]
MNKILIYLFTVLFLLLTACSDDNDNNDDSDIEMIMPLNIGNQWSYLNFVKDTLGVQRDTTYSDLNIYKDTVINDIHWYITTDEYPYKVSSLIAHRDDGLWAYGPPPYLIIKYPADIYDTWSSPGGAFEYKLTAKGVILTVPVGTFSCYEYSSHPTQGDDSTLIYYAPGYGLIKSRFWPDDGTRNEHITELTGMILIR